MIDSASVPPNLQPRSIARRLRAALARLARLVALVYLGFMLVLSQLQSSLIFPGQASQGAPTAVVTPGPGVELIDLRAAGGDRVVALFGPATSADGTPRPDASTRPTLLYFYGNGECLASSLGEFQSFRRLGANVMMVDYLGYGLSGGSAGELGCYDSASAALAHLRGRPDIHPDRILAAGWSLGGAVAVDLAHREPLAGLAVFSTFTSMDEMVRRFYPIPGIGLLLKHRFDSISKIRQVRCPTLIGHGLLDRMIPSSMADRLAENAGGPVSSFRIPSDHNDFFPVGSDTIRAELGAFIDRVAE